MILELEPAMLSLLLLLLPPLTFFAARLLEAVSGELERDRQLLVSPTPPPPPLSPRCLSMQITPARHHDNYSNETWHPTFFSSFFFSSVLFLLLHFRTAFINHCVNHHLLMPFTLARSAVSVAMQGDYIDVELHLLVIASHFNRFKFKMTEIC